MPNKFTNEEFVNRLNDATIDIVPLEEYKDINTKMNFKCSSGHIFDMTPHAMLKRHSCPVCSGKRIIKGYNDLWTIRPDVAQMLKNKDDGYTNGVGSHRTADFICPDCGSVINKTISKVVSRGFSCPICSDGISFPNKMLRFILLHSDANNIDFEFSPEWLGLKKYDGYFEKNGNKYVVEMDGGIGHGNRVFKSNKRDTERKLIDDEKDELARKHGINVIRIDCNYNNVANRLDYIKDNLINSELSFILPLNDINWEECLLFSISSFIKIAANMYDDGDNIIEIANKLNVGRATVRNWLKQASYIDICDYSPENSNKRKRTPLPSNAEPVDQFTKDGKLVQTYESIAKAKRETNILNISACLSGKQKSAGGYIWERHKEGYYVN